MSTVRCQTCGHIGFPDIDWDRRREICEDCNSTKIEPFAACTSCGEREAVCDDSCVTCQVNFHLAHPEEFDPSESCWVSDHHWIEAANLIADGLRKPRRAA
jgi:hypothetical protein